MSIETKAIVSRIGETDQLYLTENTPELALERAELRMQLVTLSRVRQNKFTSCKKPLFCWNKLVWNMKKCQ